MKDTTIPSLTSSNDGVPITIVIPPTQAQLLDQGYTYNQATFSFDQAGVDYGGIYNADESAIPALQTAFLEHPSLQFVLDSLDLTISQTQARLLDQGYTYNQAGFSYDQTGADYAGVYNQNQDTVPLSLSFTDIYHPFVPPPPTQGGFSVGPGFFMFITH